MQNTNYNIFSEEHLYKIKIRKFYKILNHHNEKTYFIFLESHGELSLLKLCKDVQGRDDYVIFFPKEEILNFFNELDIDITNVTFEDLKYDGMPDKLYECTKYKNFEIYQNDLYNFINNIYSIIDDKIILNIKNSDFKKISIEEGNKELKKLMNEINLQDSFIKDKNCIDETYEDIRNAFEYNPAKVEFLYKITVRKKLLKFGEYKSDSIGYIHIFKENDTLFYLRNGFIIDKEIKTEDYEIPEYSQISCKIKKLDNKGKEELNQIYKEYIKYKELKVKAYKPKDKLEFLTKFEENINYNHFKITTNKYNDHIRLIPNNTEFIEIDLEYLLNNLY